MATTCKYCKEELQGERWERRLLHVACGTRWKREYDRQLRNRPKRKKKYPRQKEEKMEPRFDSRLFDFHADPYTPIRTDLDAFSQDELCRFKQFLKLDLLFSRTGVERDEVSTQLQMVAERLPRNRGLDP